MDRAPKEHKVTSSEPGPSRWAVEPLVLGAGDLWFWVDSHKGEDDQGMQIHISTDKNVHGSDALMRRVEEEFESAFSRSSERITRLEVHLGDEIAARAAGLDRRCVLEARLAGHGVVSVTHHAGSVTDACHGAIRKLESVLESKFGRLYQHKGGESIRHLDVPADPAQTVAPPAGAH